jgi:anti-sigma factor RsiW
MANTLPDEDTAPPADPFEAELVAYLDGELDPAAARKVEARLASDPHARSRASALKKTFDLLDYLPKPEPSAEFTSRTLDKIPALQTASPVQPQPQPSPAVQQSQTRAPRLSQPLAKAISTARPSLQTKRTQGSLPILTETTHSKLWMWVIGILTAATGFAAVGYLGGSAFNSNHANSQSAATKEPADDLSLADRRLIENLPLYAVVDNYKFLTDLAKPEYFGDDPTVTYDSTLKVPSVQQEGTKETAFANQEKAFKHLSQERQQMIREIDKSIHAASPAVRDRLLRVLEAYVAWLNLLSDDERRGIFSAATPELRLNLIREFRDRQWVELLPPNLRKQHEMAATNSLKRKLIEDWKADEKHRREEWASARKNPSETLDTSKIPAPFDNLAVRDEILAFAKSALRLDDAKGGRLTANELDRYTTVLNFAQTQGGAAWHSYGKMLYELVKKQEEYLLPPPSDPKLRFTDFSDLPLAYQNQRILTQRFKVKVTPFVGKWPEFPLEVHKDVHLQHKESFGKSDFKPLPPLGPAKVSDFSPAVRKYLESELLSQLTDPERKGLLKEEGKWPEYSREVVRLARAHDLSIPGVMLPGSQKKWDALYGPNRGK